MQRNCQSATAKEKVTQVSTGCPHARRPTMAAGAHLSTYVNKAIPKSQGTVAPSALLTTLRGFSPGGTGWRPISTSIAPIF